MKIYPQTKFAILRFCPICCKDYDNHWKVVNHIRKTKDCEHQEFLSKQETEVFNIYMQNMGNRNDIFSKLNNIGNIFSGVAYGKIMRILNKFLNEEELENLRRYRISKTMEITPKTKQHNFKVSIAVKKAWKDGKFDTEEYKNAMKFGLLNRRSHRGVLNPMYGKPSPKGAGRGRGGIRKDIGHYVRSSWEANIARVCKFFNRKYKYEPERFYIDINGVSMSYCPDFYFPDKNLYYEIKGHAKSSDKWECDCDACVKGRDKMKAAINRYGIKVILVGAKEYKKFKKRFKSRIADWEIR